MENVILILVCLGIGLLLQRSKDFPLNSPKVLNQFVIYISLPALALFYIPKIKLGWSLWYPVGIAWGGFLLSYLFFSILGKQLGWSKKLTGCLIICAGLSNTSFVGFPVVEALYGKEGLQTAIIVDQPGSFVVLATLAVIIANIYSKRSTSTNLIVKKIFLFPPFIAFTIACLMNFLEIDFANVLQLAFQKIGNTVTPVALISVGLQLKMERNSKHWQFLALGLLFKLVIIPAFFYFLYVLVFRQKGIVIQVQL